MKVSLFVIWETWLYKLYSMLVGLVWMFAWSNVLRGIIQNIGRCGISVGTVELSKLPTPSSYMSFIIMFFAVRWNMGPGKSGNSTWHSAHCKVKRINRGRGFSIDQFNGQWNSFGYTEDRRKSRNYNWKCAKEIHIPHWDFIHICWVDRPDAPNCHLRTL